MAWVRRVRTASGATAVQVAEYVDGRRRIVAHVGSAHTEAELGLLLERARGLLGDAGQGELDLGLEATQKKARLVVPAADTELLAGPVRAVEQERVSAPQVVATSSRLLFDVLAEVYHGLGFAAVGDETFRDLVIARIVEPTSILDTGLVLIDLGQKPASEKTMRRTLIRAQQRDYRDQIATACFDHVLTSGDVSLCLYDVTTLYFEAERKTTCARSATPKNAASIPRWWSVCWSTATASRSRSAASKATRPRPPRSCRSSKPSKTATTWPTWSWSPTQACCQQATCANWTTRT